MVKQNTKHDKNCADPTSHSNKSVFPTLDNDLAADNLINDFDMTMADLQDPGEQAL